MEVPWNSNSQFPIFDDTNDSIYSKELWYFQIRWGKNSVELRWQPDICCLTFGPTMLIPNDLYWYFFQMQWLITYIFKDSPIICLKNSNMNWGNYGGNPVPFINLVWLLNVFQAPQRSLQLQIAQFSMVLMFHGIPAKCAWHRNGDTHSSIIEIWKSSK